jgi:hypothetical protein
VLLVELAFVLVLLLPPQAASSTATTAATTTAPRARPLLMNLSILAGAASGEQFQQRIHLGDRQLAGESLADIGRRLAVHELALA